MKAQIFFIIMCMWVFSGCSTTSFSVKSDPVDAQVFYIKYKDGVADKKLLGKTPLLMPMTEFKDKVGEDVNAGEFFSVAVEKDGFLTQEYRIPATKFGTSITTLDVKMKKGEQEKEHFLAKEILDHLFLAQKLALSQQYERAQLELDKVLTQYPTFARAMSMRGSIYFAQKNYAESVKWYNEAIKADPQFDEAVKMLAKVKLAQAGGSSSSLSSASDRNPATTLPGKPESGGPQ